MQSETTLKEKILSFDTYYQGLSQRGKQQKFIISGSGCRDRAQLLPLAIYRAAVCSTFFAISNQQSIAMMITASHNPASDNGIKIGYSIEKVIQKQVYQNIGECLNSRQQFEQYINNNIQKIQQKIRQDIKQIFFIGYDTRISSPQLIKIIQQVFFICQVTFINIGVCTTPQLYSFSRYLIINQFCYNINTVHDVNNFKSMFVKQVLKQFQNIYLLFNQKYNKKQKILIDLSNGSGAISILPYLNNLSKYFDIQLSHNTDLKNPNYLCGADYISRNWSITSQQQYAIYDQLVFFDGDSDRIILKMQQYEQCFDGNYFLMLYIKTFKKIMMKLKQQHRIDIEGLEFNAISTFMMNLGVKQQLNEIGVPYIVSSIGIQNIYMQALKTDKISIFFQPNGHGGVYFSDKSIKRIKQQLQKNEENKELQLLNSFYQILKNNSRGYGLHNMLMYFICKKYINLTNLDQLFHLSHQKCQNIFILPQFDLCFLNGKERDNQLISPSNIMRVIDNVVQNNKEYLITVRKSQTEKALIRVSVQGKNAKKCEQIVNKIIKVLQDFGYIEKQNHNSN